MSSLLSARSVLSARGGGLGILPPLTRPEQHRPVEPRSLGRPPRPLAQPLRHALALLTAPPAPAPPARAHRRRQTLSTSAMVTRIEVQTPSRIRLLRQSERRPRGARGGGTGAGAVAGSIPAQAADCHRLAFWSLGPTREPRTVCPDFQPWPPTYSSLFTWQLALLNATSTCRVLKASSDQSDPSTTN